MDGLRVCVCVCVCVLAVHCCWGGLLFLLRRPMQVFVRSASAQWANDVVTACDTARNQTLMVVGFDSGACVRACGRAGVCGCFVTCTEQ